MTWSEIFGIFTKPLFQLGQTWISLATIVEFLLVVTLVVLFSRLTRRVLRTRVLAHTKLEVGLQYAIARIISYIILVLGLLIGLFFLVYVLVYAGALIGEALGTDAPPDVLLRRALWDAIYAAPWATAVSVPTYPNHTDRSVYINSQALPILKSETLQAHMSANINLVSGASDSSQAFAESLQSAILKAKKA